MSQEATPNDEVEQERDDMLLASLQESTTSFEKVLESLEGIPTKQMRDVSLQLEEVGETIQSLQDTSLDNDPEVSRAIQQINSKQETDTGDRYQANDVAERVAGLYDEARLEAMRELLEEHNLRIVQQLLASDTGALSPKEVAFRNRGIIAESTVRDHLRTLAKKGFVEKLEPDVESIPNEMPRTFYAASPLTIELLQEMGLWENLGMLYQIYNSLDRPEDIQRIEEWDGRPIPEWI